MSQKVLSNLSLQILYLRCLQKSNLPNEISHLRNTHLSLADIFFYTNMDKQLSKSLISEDEHYQTNIPYYIQPNPQTANNEKTNKQIKDYKKNNKQSKDTKDPTKIKTKSEPSQFIKDQQKDYPNLSSNLKKAKQQIVQQPSSSLKLNIKEELSFLQYTIKANLSQEKLARLYIQHKGDIQKLAFVLRIPKLQTICKMVLPIIKNALRSMQGIIKKRKLRRVFLAWNQQQIKEFIHKFFQIKNGQLEGYSKKIDLTTYWKLIESKYDNTITLKNEQAHDFYKSCLDIHLSVYEDIENRGTDFNRYMTWSRPELKVLCRCLLKTDDLQKVSDVMMIEYGRSKEKFAPKKIFQQIDILIRMSISKIKHQSVTYPGLGEIRKIMKYDFYNINYNQEPRYDKIRKELIRYFQMDSPSLQESYAILHKLNRFIIEERIHEKNQISELNAKEGLLLRNSGLGRSGDGYEAGQEENKSVNKQINQNDTLTGIHGSRVQQVKVERAESTGNNLTDSKFEQNSIMGQSRISTREPAKQIHPELKNLMSMNLDLTSSSDEQQQQPKPLQGLVPIELQK